MHPTIAQPIEREVVEHEKVEHAAVNEETNVLVVEFCHPATWDYINIPMKVAIDHWMFVREYKYTGPRTYRYVLGSVDTINR